MAGRDYINFLKEVYACVYIKLYRFLFSHQMEIVYSIYMQLCACLVLVIRFFFFSNEI